MQTNANSILDDSIKTIHNNILNIAEGLTDFAKRLPDLSPEGYQKANQLTYNAVIQLIRKCEYISGVTNNNLLHKHINRLETELREGMPDMGTRRFDNILLSLLEIDRACNCILIARNERQCEASDLKDKIDTAITLIKAGFRMVLNNMPLTFKAAKEYGASISQQTRAKTANKTAHQTPSP